MKKIITSLISLAITASAFAAESSSDASDWYVSPLASYIQSDQSRINTDDAGRNLKLGFGKEVSDSFNLELGLGLNRFDTVDNSSDLKQLGLELDALYFFNRESAFSPYIATGIGMVNTSDTDDTNPNWSAGVGLLTEVGFLKDAKFRTELRFQQEYDSGEYAHDDLLLRAGVQIPIGGESKPAPAKPMLKDTDGDGVNDADDKCPATRDGAEVNSYGCELDADRDGVVNSKDQCPNTPRGVEVATNGCKIDGDSDNDGVKDSMEQCPNTLAGTVVDARGCPVDPDSDKDGVPDSKDQCSNSAAGVRIDFKGCEINDVISLPGINFETNSSQLTSSSAATLDGAAATLNKFTDIAAEVAGHTDATGADSYNMSLSGKRAKAVKDYLISKGVSASRLSSKGYGETQPIADNSSKSGRAINRRVDLNILK